MLGRHDLRAHAPTQIFQTLPVPRNRGQKFVRIILASRGAAVRRDPLESLQLPVGLGRLRYSPIVEHRYEIGSGGRATGKYSRKSYTVRQLD